MAYSFFLDRRVLGGLLSAYDLSGDKIFLEKAKDLADRLLPAWNTPSGIPYNRINLMHGNPHNFGWTGVSFELLSALESSNVTGFHDKIVINSFGASNNFFPF